MDSEDDFMSGMSSDGEDNILQDESDDGSDGDGEFVTEWHV